MRKANLVKRSRAALSRTEVKNFFDHYNKTAANIPASDIINVDETNLREDPGANKKAVFQRGVKYTEQICDHTKSCNSIMFAGMAAGDLLPPYVIYKAQYCYPSWCKGGIKGAFYTSMPSGWFNNYVFVNWLKDVFVPYCRRLSGKKLLLEDNLASHISMEVIDICKEEIEFVCLPPNSTDKMQPLDVGFFGPMKTGWRKQLHKYQDQDPEAKLLKKTKFPAMLKELVEGLNPKQHLPNAFRKCGLFPFNREEVLNRIPVFVPTQEIAKHMDAALLKKLEVRRFGDASKKKQPRGKKIPAGQSYCAEEDSRSDEDNVESEVESKVEVESEVEVENEVEVVSKVEMAGKVEE